MLYSLLQTVALTTPEEATGNIASMAGIVSLQGMLTIFLVLSVLWGAIEVMHLLLHKDEKKEKPVKKAAPAPVAQPTDDAAIAAAIAASLAATEGDAATVAAIVAAISAKRAEEGCDGGFRVVSFKRVGKSAAHRRF